MQNSTSPIKKTIYLIRHGQTDFNKQGIVQGSGVNSSLNEEGMAQAQRFFEAFQHIPFEKIYITELVRTHQSVAPFKLLNIPTEIMPEFNEINWGVQEGVKPTPEHIAQFQSILAQWREGQLDTCVENGETPLELFARQKIGLQKVLSSPEELVLICMHGRAIRSFLCLLTGHPLHRMDEFEHNNLCLYLLEKNSDQEHFTIKLHNYQDHLID